jgi:hypothetical protein
MSLRQFCDSRNYLSAYTEKLESGRLRTGLRRSVVRQFFHNEINILLGNTWPSGEIPSAIPGVDGVKPNFLIFFRHAPIKIGVREKGLISKGLLKSKLVMNGPDQPADAQFG